MNNKFSPYQFTTLLKKVLEVAVEVYPLFPMLLRRTRHYIIYYLHLEFLKVKRSKGNESIYNNSKWVTSPYEMLFATPKRDNYGFRLYHACNAGNRPKPRLSQRSLSRHVFGWNIFCRLWIVVGLK